MGLEQEGLKTKSFRDETYSSRRVFLRSYPLQWEEGEEEGEHEVVDRHRDEDEVCKLSFKGKLIAVIQWGGDKVFLMKKIKNKAALYLVSCQPFKFKSPKKMLTV